MQINTNKHTFNSFDLKKKCYLFLTPVHKTTCGQHAFRILKHDEKLVPLTGADLKRWWQNLSTQSYLSKMEHWATKHHKNIQ